MLEKKEKKSFLIKALSEMEFKFLINDLPLEIRFEMFATTNHPDEAKKGKWMNFMLVGSSSRDTFSSGVEDGGGEDWGRQIKVDMVQ